MSDVKIIPPAEDWSDGPIGNDDGYTDVDQFEESMEFPANTLAGIIERANALTGPYGSLDTFRSYVRDLAMDADVDQQEESK